MNCKLALEKLIHSYELYYDIYTQDIVAPFVAEAEFKSHTEKFLLVKAAKIADIDSNEFVYFYCDETHADFILSSQKITELAQTAWERGLARITPYYGHRNTDISLIILADKISEESFKTIKKLKFYKSYKFGFYGWSSFRALAYETSTGRSVTNRRGSDLKKLVDSL